VNLLQRLNRPAPVDLERSWNLWNELVNVNGRLYPLSPTQTIQGKTEEIDQSFASLVQYAYMSNGVVAACMLVRQLLFSEARPMFRQLRGGMPGDLFSNPSLDILRRPWPNGVMGDLLTAAITDADLAGNSFFVRRPGRIKRLRPDWVTIVLGSEDDPATEAGDVDAEVVGYVYHPGGRWSGRDPSTFMPEEVCHFAPLPDPLASFRGMSWLTPVVREVMGDSAARDHKLKFFEQGATPNMVVSLDATIGRDAFNLWVETLRDKTEGLANAYRTLYLGAGADVKVVGSDLHQMEFKTVQGAGETRIAAAAGVPPVIVGLSEGLQAATYSNYGQARRRFADGTMWPLWRKFWGSMESIVPAPAGSELWMDANHIPFLREDQRDIAEIQASNAAAIRTLTDAGYRPETVVDAVTANDLGRLEHTGLYSVQLQPPQPNQPVAPVPPEPTAAPSNGTAPKGA
jgi:phage portal protein BeeE